MKHATVPFWFLLPSLGVFVLILLLPALGGFVFSFSDWKGYGDFDWVGLDNYVGVFENRGSQASLRNTLVLALVVVAGQNLLGLALALALSHKFPGRNLLRTLFFLPAVVSPVIIGYLWQFVYSYDGPINSSFRALGVEGWARTWLGDPATALWAVAVAVVWQLTGSAMVIYLAGLEAVDGEILDAASVDGAGDFKRTWYIRLPLLAPAITINLALSIITGLRIFDQIIAMTGGGPGYATETIATTIYRQSVVFGQFASGLALSIILAISVAVFSAIQVIVTRRLELVSR
jgi:raffinose/stachyose/melibiose transport system permease protein